MRFDGTVFSALRDAVSIPRDKYLDGLKIVILGQGVYVHVRCLSVSFAHDMIK